MTNDKITATRETLIHDTDTLKRDAGQIVEDVKNHAHAHVDVAKETVNNALNQAHDYVKERPFHVAAVALFIGFLIGTFRRK
jgi:ElaB/YqjD/DUF883 family membrane-anchored ribosome-binding protein